MPVPEEVLSGILGQQVEEESKANEQQAQLMQALQARTSEAQQRLIEKIMPSRQVPWPPEVLAIAQALIAQPRLIPIVAAYLQKLVAAVNDAVTKALADATPK